MASPYLEDFFGGMPLASRNTGLPEDDSAEALRQLQRRMAQQQAAGQRSALLEAMKLQRAKAGANAGVSPDFDPLTGANGIGTQMQGRRDAAQAYGAPGGGIDDELKRRLMGAAPGQAVDPRWQMGNFQKRAMGPAGPMPGAAPAGRQPMDESALAARLQEMVAPGSQIRGGRYIGGHGRLMDRSDIPSVSGASASQLERQSIQQANSKFKIAANREEAARANAQKWISSGNPVLERRGYNLLDALDAKRKEGGPLFAEDEGAKLGVILKAAQAQARRGDPQGAQAILMSGMKSIEDERKAKREMDLADKHLAGEKYRADKGFEGQKLLAEGKDLSPKEEILGIYRTKNQANPAYTYPEAVQEYHAGQRLLGGAPSQSVGTPVRNPENTPVVPTGTSPMTPGKQLSKSDEDVMKLRIELNRKRKAQEEIDREIQRQKDAINPRYAQDWGYGGM